MLGLSDEQKKATLEKAIQGATDLTGLVKKRKPSPMSTSKQATPSKIELNGKRKHDDDNELAAEKKRKVDGQS